MANFGIFKGFSDKLYEGELPTQLGTVGSVIIPVGLLDLYPNAAAAFSLRKLRTDYTGSAIRVRRSSDNTEQDIGFTAFGELNASSLTSFCGSGNGFVTTWYDQSGNARNATQTTAANQPQIVSSGNVITQNGKSSIYFGINGNDASVRLATSSFTTISQPYTVFSAFKTDTNDRQCFFDGISSNSQIAFITNWWMVTDSSTYGTSTTSMQLHSNFFNASTNFNAAQNGVLSTLNYSVTSLNGITLGHLRNAFATNYQFNGNLSECVVYPVNQSTNRLNIESNINSYYGIY